MATNEELIKQIRSNPTNKNELLQTLFEQNQTLIKTQVKPYLHSIELEEALQIAFISMYDAIEVYDESKALFMTIYPYYIRRDIVRHLERNTIAKIPSYMYERIRELDRTKAQFIEEYNQEPTTSQLAFLMSITTEQVKEILKAKRKIKSVSLDTPIQTDEAENLTLLDTIADEKNESEEVIQTIWQEELAHDIWQAVAELPTKEQEAIRLKYQDNCTLEQIGASIGVSNERARQHINNALHKLRTGKNRKTLRAYFEEYITIAYKGSVGSWKNTNTSSTEYVALKLYDASERIEAKEERIKHILEEEKQAQEQRKIALIRERQQAMELEQAQRPVIELPQATIDNVIKLMRERGQVVTEAEVIRMLNCKIV